MGLSEPSPFSSTPDGTGTRVVVADDDLTALDLFQRLLQRAGFCVRTAADGNAALAAARAGFDAMLLDVHLGSDNGLDVLRALRAEGCQGRIVVVTGFDTAGIEQEARALDAEFVDRWTLPDPVALVQALLAGTRLDATAADALRTPPALTRWAQAVAGGIGAASDPKTLRLWAHAVGKSPSSLREICSVAGIPSKASCRLVRVLRATHLSNRGGGRGPLDWLEVADARTLRRLLAQARLRAGGPTTVGAVLETQQFVTDHRAVALLSRELRRLGLV
jgi:CheY-like chemotaxis protein